MRVTEKVVLLHPLNTKGKTGLWKSLAKFFESLRPAQDLRRGSAAGIGTFKEGTPKRTSRLNPRFREKQKQDNSTTKSLILAQDER